MTEDKKKIVFKYLSDALEKGVPSQYHPCTMPAELLSLALISASEGELYDIDEKEIESAILEWRQSHCQRGN